MILLPSPPTRAALRAFWLAASLAAGAAAWLGLSAAGGPAVTARLAAAAGVAAFVLVPGWLRPYDLALPYRVWNRLARRFSRVATRYVTAVCFWTAGIALGIAARPRRLERHPASRSTWRPRGTQPNDFYTSVGDAALSVAGTHWTAPLREWFRVSAPPLAWLLLPFIVLIRLVDIGSDKPRPVSTSMYSLY